MMEEFEARGRILAAVEAAGRGGEESVSLSRALGRVLASDLVGRVDLPGFDNSSMDGYAVRAADAIDGSRLVVVGEQPAGEDRRLRLGPGEAIRIFTGAPLPEGADAVVMQEDVRRAADTNEIQVLEGVRKGENIRPRGGDVCAGQRLLTAGVSLDAAAIGLLASQGVAEVSVRSRPRVGIVTTGDELVAPGAVSPESLPMGALYNSNGPMLEALARGLGGETRCWHAPDEPEVLKRILEEAIEASDFLVVAGGVSVGDRDFVKETLADLGVGAEFWRVRVKPGKPFLFGQRRAEARSSSVFVFGLPGNPVSAFVTFQIFAAPAIDRWTGRIRAGQSERGAELSMTPWRARLFESLENRGDRPHYLRVRIDSESGDLKTAGLQQSHALFGLCRSDALLRMEAGETMEAGQEVTAWRW